MKYKYRIIKGIDDDGDPLYTPLYAPETWPFQFGYRKLWRGAVALATLPLYFAGTRIGWRRIRCDRYIGTLGYAKELIDQHAISHEISDYESDMIIAYNPYPKIMEQRLKETEHLVE